jgi:hypothetical protein
VLIGEAAGVVSTLKNAYDIIEKVRRSDDRDELRNAVAALADMLLGARAAALQLIEEKAALQDEVYQLKRTADQLSDFTEPSPKYERMRTPTGKFIYKERNATDDGPRFCPTCFTNKKASILVIRQNDRYALCHECKWGGHL